MSIDLHVHSNASDGTLSPAAVVEAARAAGVTALALTDHDTMDGVSEAMAAAEALGLELVRDVDHSTDRVWREVHN
ncbi:MAG: PHP domain-containing protein, partial [Bacillota bacterium]